MNNLVLPKRAICAGRIMSAKRVDPNTNGLFSSEVTIVTLLVASAKDVAGAVMNELLGRQSFTIGLNMSDSFAKTNLLFEGNYVALDVDVCVADKTQYEIDGDAFYHTEDHLSVRDMFNASDEDIHNMLYPDALQAAFDANSRVFKGLDVAAIATISASTAEKSIATTIEKLQAKRDQNVLVISASSSAPKTVTRAENLDKLIADLEARTKTATPALKPTLEAKLNRLKEQRATLA